jgi:hypothetical protein
MDKSSTLGGERMRVETVEEHEDGSADVVLKDLSPQELALLVKEGFIAIIKRSLDKIESEGTKNNE